MWRRLTGLNKDGAPIEFNATELITLEQACRTADMIANLEAALERDGLVITGSKGQSRLSSVPAELRLQRIALTRLVAALAVPYESEAEGLSPTQRRAQRAAEARWSRQAPAREAKHG